MLKLPRKYVAICSRIIRVLIVVVLVAATVLAAISNWKSLVIGAGTRSGHFAGITICQNRLFFGRTFVSSHDNVSANIKATWIDSDVANYLIEGYRTQAQFRYERFGFLLASITRKPGDFIDDTLVAIPVWIPIALAWFPLCRAMYLRRRRSRWRREGLCGSCAYDLRGITSEKCPECGSAFQRQTIR